MKTCAKCGGEFKNRGGRFCSVECSGNPSKNRRHGLCETPEYNSWTSMRERCNNKNRPAYQSYGAKGIRYCERWEVFENFLADMGLRPSPAHTLERIDNSGNYGPDNCKWGTKAEQSQNRSNCATPEDDELLRRLIVDERCTFQEASEIMGKPKITIQGRVRRLRLPYAHKPQKITDRPGHPLNESGLHLHDERKAELPLQEQQP
jgi:hypothetical protein